MPHLQRSRAGWAVAQTNGVLGQILRDRGLLDEAIDAYQRACADTDKLGMAAWSAYLKVVLAETLIAAGRQVEASSVIIEALPVFEREGLVTETVVAVSLLRESLLRQQPDEKVLRTLREHLARLRDRSDL